MASVKEVLKRRTFPETYRFFEMYIFRGELITHSELNKRISTSVYEYHRLVNNVRQGYYPPEYEGVIDCDKLYDEFVEIMGMVLDHLPIDFVEEMEINDTDTDIIGEGRKYEVSIYPTVTEDGELKIIVSAEEVAEASESEVQELRSRG